MYHPQSRGERRYARLRAINRRRQHFQDLYRGSYNMQARYTEPEFSMYFQPSTKWGRYAKWNGSCSCSYCRHNTRIENEQRDRWQREELRFQIEAEGD